MNITNDIITAYIDSLYKSGNPQLMELRQFAEDKHIPIILKETESLLLNILWLIFSGVPLALQAVLNGALFCVTIVGIPFGMQCFKMAKLALMPFGSQVRG